MGFRGEITTLPVGLQGFNGSKNPSRLAPGHLSYVEGVDLDGDVLIKDGGASKLNSSALSGGILSGFNWSPARGSYHDIVFCDDGAIFKDTGAGTFGVTLATVGVPAIYPPFFCAAGGEDVGEDRKLFIMSDAHQMKVVVGTADTASDISNPAADWSASFPIFAVQHDNRLWAGGNASDPHRIYYSLLTDQQDFVSSGSGSLSVYPGEGEIIVGGLSFNGLLVLWKYPKGIYIVDTTDPDITNWSVRPLTKAVGAVSPWCIIPIGNDVMYLMNDGTFHVMSATNAFGDLNTSNISHEPNYFDVFMRSNVNLTNLRSAMGCWYGSKSKAWFGVPQVGTTRNNMRVMIDFNNAQVGPRFFLSRRDDIPGIWMRPDNTGVEHPVTGDNDGFVWLMDQDARNKDGEAYTMQLETSENDFSFADQRLAAKTKNGAYIEISADLISETMVNVVPLWDGLETDPLTLTLGGAGAALDAFILDVDELSSSGIVTAKNKLTGQGRRLKLIVTNNELDDEVRLSEFRVAYTVGDERSRQDG